jgi:predicted RecB family nuclease
VPPCAVDNLDNARDVLLNATLKASSLQAECALLTKVNTQLYEPTIFIGSHSINDTDILRLWFIGHVLTEVQGRPPAMGHIVAVDGKSSKIKLQQVHKTFISLLDPLQKWAANDTSPDEPPVLLNKHCPMCQFRIQCEAKARQEDNLSRLKGVTPKVIRQYEKKGIFTVKQLSHTFKPRKRKKRARNPPVVTHKPELQALAIREEKIYLQEPPELNRQSVELFLDIEGIPDQQLYYLIGLLICEGDTSTYYSFWADTPQDESKIWQQFLKKINQYPKAPIYHYGSYESKAITKLTERYDTADNSLKDQLININSYIYGKIYFPVYSNHLKEIGNFIGANWTSSDASGLQSLVWRHHWDENRHIQYKTLLLTYNEEDCRAVKLLTEELIKIKDSANTLSDVDFADKRRNPTTEISQEIHSQFDSILKFAHFDYDKKKISFSVEKPKNETEEDKKGKRRLSAYKSNQRREEAKSKVTKVIQVTRGEVCPVCGYKPLRPTEHVVQRTIIDLVLIKGGIKKTVTQYVGFQGYCVQCFENYSPPDIRRYERRQLYGHGLKVWIAYQRVAMRLPYSSIIETIEEHFGEKISKGRLPDFIQEIGNYYAEIEKSIVRSLLKSPYIHADETDISVQGTNQYVWVFTDGKYVVFRLSETRESSIVHEFLGDYEGVLISDFYPGYDSVKCRQQKCWVHLIRNLNDDLLENPFDTEYEAFVLAVKQLIIPIMESVQNCGLKRRYLNKFKKDVDNFTSK